MSTSCRTWRAGHRGLRQQDLCLGRQIPQQRNPHGLCPHLWCRERLLGGRTPAGGWYFWDGCLCPHVAQGYFNGNREVALRMARRPNEASSWLSIRSYERIRLGGIWQLKWRLENFNFFFLFFCQWMRKLRLGESTWEILYVFLIHIEVFKGFKSKCSAQNAIHSQYLPICKCSAQNALTVSTCAPARKQHF